MDTMNNMISIHSEEDTRFHAVTWKFDGFLVFRLKIGDTTVETYVKDEDQLADLRKTIAESEILHKKTVYA